MTNPFATFYHRLFSAEIVQVLGIIGTTGPTGIIGAIGITGQTGIIGATGIIGVTGTIGVTTRNRQSPDTPKP